ncbi:hypothetical protein nbrc107696_08000 [Gordonia spumicola]|uniref:GGDEF-domain containing protein n=1 Tax=Gordonia spumicola TaxID=589161 RepID=A0A7I9V599_9ACTN|nr:bifunctional diguanylate cyclase/phosphodiesterase [Gordonia spumicola]GEE00354.1 hypothetical protein nbrc107696_08000 [Gordonia spumicola]
MAISWGRGLLRAGGNAVVADPPAATDIALGVVPTNYGMLLNLVSRPVVLWSDGVIVYANPAAERTARPVISDSLVGHPITDVVDVDSVARLWSTVLSGRGARTSSAHVRIQLVCRAPAVVQATVSEVVLPDLTAIQLIFDDPTLASLARKRDDLTGLHSRSGVVDKLAAQIGALDPRGDRRVAVITLDLDGFSRINDSMGADVGDEILTAIADSLRAAVPVGAVVGRLGADEFVVAATVHDQPDGSADLIGRVRSVVSEPVPTSGGSEHWLNMRMGLAVASRGDRPSDVLRDSSIARRRASFRRDPAYLRFQQEFREEAQHRLGIEKALRTTLAFTPEHLVVVYQPIIALSDRRVVGFEALVRWNDPERGLMLPGDFIPIAEESDLIEQVGGHVIDAAIREVAAAVWADDVFLSINLSSRELCDADLAPRLAALCDEVGMDPRRLRIEVTETGFAVDGDVMAAAAGQLRAVGIGVFLDDFGSGQSSLSRLVGLPATGIKTPCEFVRNVEERSDVQALLSCVVALAGARGVDVVIEGIENAAQEKAVADSGAELVQGFLYGRPAPLSDFASSLVLSGH